MQELDRRSFMGKLGRIAAGLGALYLAATTTDPELVAEAVMPGGGGLKGHRLRVRVRVVRTRLRRVLPGEGHSPPAR